jgi:hypothetical protein
LGGGREQQRGATKDETPSKKSSLAIHDDFSLSTDDAMIVIAKMAAQ